MAILRLFQMNRAQGYKTFFILRSFENEIYPAIKHQNTTNLIQFNFFMLNRAEHENYPANHMYQLLALNIY